MAAQTSAQVKEDALMGLVSALKAGVVTVVKKVLVQTVQLSMENALKDSVNVP